MDAPETAVLRPASVPSSDDALCAAGVEAMQQAQRPERVGAAVHEVADGMQLVGVRIEAHGLE